MNIYACLFFGTLSFRYMDEREKNNYIVMDGCMLMNRSPTVLGKKDRKKTGFSLRCPGFMRSPR